MQVNTYILIVLIIISTEFLINLIVSFLDYYYKPTTKNPSIKKDYVKAKRYLRTNIKFSLIKSVIDLAILLAIIFSGAFNYLDIVVRSLGYGPILTGMIFLGVIGLIFFIIGIPFSIYKTFRIEKKYNFNKTTRRTFIIDLLKSIVGWIIMGTVGLAIILTFFEKAGNLAWFYCWIAITLLQIFTIFLYPITILPVFNKLKILTDGPLKDTIQKYLEIQNINIKMENIRVIDSSRRTNKSNAFLTGFGRNKRLVLSDTLLKNHTVPEILAIVAHEIGHLKMNHLSKKLILYTIETFLMMYLLSIVIINSNFFLAFGVENTSVYIGLLLFGIIYFPLELFFSTLTNHYSKKYEYMADKFSAETTTPEDMASALDKLSSHNLTNPSPHPITVALKYTHPPIKDRIGRLINNK